MCNKIGWTFTNRNECKNIERKKLDDNNVKDYNK